MKGMRPFVIGLLVLSSTGMVSASTPGNALARITDPEIWQLDTMELARRMLPPELSVQVVSHKVIEGLPRHLSRTVQFDLAAQSVDTDLCKRDRLIVGLKPDREDAPGWLAQEPIRWHGIALGTDCESIPPTRYARVQPRSVDAETAGNVLRWLEQLRHSASEGRLDAPVECQFEAIGENPCERGLLQVVSMLPVEQAWLIQPLDRGQEGWSVSLMPHGPGQVFWDVSLISDAGSTYRVGLRWRIPAPF